MKWTSHLAQGWTRIAGAQHMLITGLQKIIIDVDIIKAKKKSILILKRTIA